MTFYTQLQQVSCLLDRLAELHRREVEEARSGTADLRSSQPTDAYAAHEPKGTSNVLLLPKAFSCLRPEFDREELNTEPAELTNDVGQKQCYDVVSESVAESMVSLEVLGTDVAEDGNEISPARHDTPLLPLQHCEHDEGSENTEIARGEQSNTNSVDIEEGDLQAADLLRQESGESEQSFDIAGTASSRLPTPRSARRQIFRTRDPWMFEAWMHGINIMEMVMREKAIRKDSISDFWGSVPSVIEIKVTTDPMPPRWYILVPHSKFLTSWMIFCLMLLLYDVVVLPLDFCFEMQATVHQRVMDATSAAVWTVDMVLSFFTSVRKERELEVRPAQIRYLYMKSWFAFDLVVLLADYATLLMNASSSHALSILRVARIRRFVGLLRVARLLRLSKLRTMMSRSALLIYMPKTYIQLTHGWIGVSALIVLFLHFVSCFWYLLGRRVDNGWVGKNNLGSASVGQVYAISMHWSFSRMHGLTAPYIVDSTFELFIETLLIYLSLVLASVYTSLAVTVCMARFNGSSFRLWKLSIAYGRRHAISLDLKARLLKFLESLNCAGAREIFQEEQDLLQIVDVSLRNDLLFESRVPFLLKTPYLRDLYWVNARVVFRLCIDAMEARVFSEEEVIFAHGDHCHWMLFLTEGRLYYLKDINPHDSLSRLQPRHFPMVKFECEADARRGSPQAIRQTLFAGSSISEPVLWTKWTHIWRLVASQESTTLVLDPEAFVASISAHEVPTIHANKYARGFVKGLNRVQEPDDLVVFDDLNIEQLDDTEDAENAGDVHAHFMFLSHYKVEAGTEATLMGELLIDLLNQNPQHPAHDFHSPIFIDSEDLTDLADLKKHVRMTTALVLLLTPGVLSRPWCLVELVTAVKHDVKIVLVDIQRPGSRYRYPDDEFYADLLMGKFLPRESTDLLQSEGITLRDVEKALRQVFLKIALPFSPHKTKTIREAELIDILKRCSTGDEFVEVKCTVERSLSMSRASSRTSTRSQQSVRSLSKSS